MKVYIPLAIAAALVIAAAAVYAGVRTADSFASDAPDGRELTAQWNEYEKAASADRPKKMLEILGGIKAEALRRHLPVDFYDAASLYVERGRSLNWKSYDSLKTAFAAEVKKFDEPLVTFLWGAEYGGKGLLSQMELLREHATALQHTRRPELWRIGTGSTDSYRDFMTNDYEYALWALLDRTYYGSVNPEHNEAYVALRDYLKDSYPGAGRLEYQITRQRYTREVRLEKMRELARKYQGKALALFPREDILRAEFDSLEKAKAPEKAYRQLHERCKEYLKEKNAFTGNEKKLAAPLDGVDGLAQTLSEQRIGLKVRNDSVILYFRNTSKAVLTLYERKADGTRGKDLKTWNVTNKAGSFYLIDRERIAVPKLDDGEYGFEMTSGKMSSDFHYSSHTLSLALRKDADAFRFYAADYVTGKPLEAVKLILYKGGAPLKEATVTQHGFTPLPEGIQRSVERATYYTMRASYKDKDGVLRLSNEVSFNGSRPYSGDDKFSQDLFCHIYKDKGAYNPDDLMHFKAVIFRGDLRSEVQVLPEGEKVEVILKNASGKQIASKTLATTAFGSVSGEFVLERGERNGYYSLEVMYGKKHLASDSFRVDDFILPTFTVSLESPDTLFTPGDEVTVKGKVESYSGHSLTAATVRYKVSRYGAPAAWKELPPQPDGSFDLTFTAGSDGVYSVEVTVTDATGETAESTCAVCITSRFTLSGVVSNKADATLFLIGDEKNRRFRYYYDAADPAPSVVNGTLAEVTLFARNSDRVQIPMTIDWKLLYDADGGLVKGGTASSGEKLSFDLGTSPSGLYRLEMKASAKDHNGDTMSAEGTVRFLLVKPGDKKITAPVRRVIIPGETFVEAEGNVSVRFGSNDGPTWAVATLYGLNCTVLETRILQLQGGDLTDIAFRYKKEWPDAVRLRIFYFKYGQEISFDRVFRKVRHSLDMPVTFSSFTDMAHPSTRCTFTLQAEPGVEAVAAVYDKSLDAIARNHWAVVKASDLSVSSVSISSADGSVTGSDPYRFSPGYRPEPEDDGSFPRDEGDIVLFSRAAGSFKAKAAGNALGANMVMMDAAPAMAPAEIVEEAIAEEASASEVAEAGKVTVREVFSDALTFQPHLLSDGSGKIELNFSTSDKLSTYYVSVYAHGKDMRNGLAMREMKVTVPVKVAVVEPKYLYETDSYVLGTTVSSNTDEDLSGKLYLMLYPGTDHEHLQPLSSLVREVTIPAGGSLGETFQVQKADVDTLGVKIVFVAGEGESKFSDAVFVPIEMKKAVQTLTESHSAVWLHGMDREALKVGLRSRFVNVSPSEAAYSEITILDMVKEALPAKFEPSGRDVLSLSETYYVRLLSSLLKTGGKQLPEDSGQLLEKILACRNADGGFGWFEGMNSSRIITAVLLERFAALRDRGFSVPDLTSAVKYLDNGQFSEAYPFWCGWLSDSQYLYVRSMYAQVEFGYKPSGKEAKERFAAFQKATKAYLTPSRKDGRGLDGYILGKARRIKTLRQLLDSPEGIALAKSFGLRISAKNRMDKSMVADLLSLVEYNVKHRDGGRYYPNAVMPYRGLLESEAYAHSLICDLLTTVGKEKNAAIQTETGEDALAVADGIRLWLMLQKETQQWGEDPGFVNAISSVLDGSPEVLATQVLIYKATYTKPFKEIKAAGNGFTIARHFFREKADSRELEPVEPGTMLRKGDRIVAKYEIWNQENRSFVKLTAPREASLRPVNQLSGHVGWWLRPLRAGWYSFSPQGYRNVLIDRTEYYFDSYPEEKTTVTEEFFVTQAGSFSAPVVTIESLYAPHYRANGAFGGVWSSK